MLIFNNFSTCFGHHYAHLQENKTYATACGVLRCNKRGKLDISFNVFFVWYCVVNLDEISCVYESVYMHGHRHLKFTLHVSGVNHTHRQEYTKP